MEKTSGVEKNTRIKRILLRLFLIVLTSVLIIFFIEWRFFGNDFERAFNFAFVDSTPVFFYNVLLLFFIELVISSLFKTALTGPGVTFILAIIVSYINSSKYIFRGQPLLPEDFMLADQTGTLTKFIDFSSLVKTVLACLLVVGLILLLNHLSRKIFGSIKEEKGGFFRKNFRLLRVVSLAVGIFGFITGTGFVRNHSGERTVEVAWLNTTLVAWNQQLNYENNGFILGFMYNWEKFEMQEPEGYSKGKIAEIKEEYTLEDSDKTDLEDLDVNIITILNESFFDPNIISDYYPYSKNTNLTKNSMGIPVTDDVIPTIRNLISNSEKARNFATGQMYSTDYGGGTANIEFEIDTTMTNYWVNTVPFVDLFPHVDSVPSVASSLKTAGYDTVAIHPFNGGMYKRNIALTKEGLDEFITEDEMEFRDHDDNRQYINDRSAYRETLKTLEEHKEKTYISLITMQNHSGYGAEDYSTRSYILSEAPKAGENKTPFSNDEKGTIEVYLETLHNSDYYLSEFLDELEKSDEKTVVLFYGDHAPGILTRVNDALDKETRDLAKTTPYFIWANFEFPNKTTAKLPKTTPNCLSVTTLTLLNVNKPDFMNLAEAACADTPILTPSYFGDAGFEESETLHNYQLYIYDVLGGKRYWYE